MSCCVRNCFNVKLKDAQHRSFHIFPKNENLRLQWSKNLKIPVESIKTDMVVCSDHFESKEIVQSHTGKQRLRLTAVPTKLLEDDAYKHQNTQALGTKSIALMLNATSFAIENGPIVTAIQNIPAPVIQSKPINSSPDVEVQSVIHINAQKPQPICLICMELRKLKMATKSTGQEALFSFPCNQFYANLWREAVTVKFPNAIFTSLSKICSVHFPSLANGKKLLSIDALPFIEPFDCATNQPQPDRPVEVGDIIKLESDEENVEHDPLGDTRCKIYEDNSLLYDPDKAELLDEIIKDDKMVELSIDSGENIAEDVAMHDIRSNYTTGEPPTKKRTPNEITAAVATMQVMSYEIQSEVPNTASEINEKAIKTLHEKRTYVINVKKVKAQLANYGSNVCRFCVTPFTTENVKTSTSIFDDIYSNGIYFKVADILMSLIPNMQIDINDKLPKKNCLDCKIASLQIICLRLNINESCKFLRKTFLKKLENGSMKETKVCRICRRQGLVAIDDIFQCIEMISAVKIDKISALLDYVCIECNMKLEASLAFLKSVKVIDDLLQSFFEVTTKGLCSTSNSFRRLENSKAYVTAVHSVENPVSSSSKIPSTIKNAAITKSPVKLLDSESSVSDDILCALKSEEQFTSESPVNKPITSRLTVLTQLPHKDETKKETRKICHLCGKNVFDINSHLRTDHAPKIKCKSCEHEFYSETALAKHNQIAHEQVRLKVWPKNSKKSEKLSNPIAAAPKRVCLFCGKIFSADGMSELDELLRNHVIRAHADD